MNAESVWALYEKGLRHHHSLNLTSETEKAYRFYEGDQWYGVESDQTLPFYNFIAPVVNYKVASIAASRMTVYFSDQAYTAEGRQIVQALNARAARWWERLKMDAVCWQILKESVIAGDSYLYVYDGKGNCQTVDGTDLFLGDETQRDLQRQPYILIYERRDAAALRERALQNGVPEEQAGLIVSDAHNEGIFAHPAEDDGKCGCLLYMTVRDGDLYFSRWTRYAAVEPEQRVPGMNRYPIAALVCNPRKGSARGRGEVLPLIPNQIEINRNLVRRIVNAKMTAFSRLVYATDKIDNPEDLNRVGTAIAVNDSTVLDVHNAVDYVTPSPMSGDAKAISDELLVVSRELSGASGTALASVDPTQASGTAILAVRDQAQIPLNELSAALRQFVEDVALIWLRLWSVYPADGETPDCKALRRIRPSVRIDATDTTPFSRYAREQTLQSFFEKGAITLEEFAGALDDDASVPKAKLLDIVKKRKGEEQ